MGVFQPRTFRGRLLSVVATASISAAVHRERSVPLGKYWRRSPLVFSFMPRCQGLWGSAKNTSRARVDLQLGVLGEFLAAVPGQ